MAKRANVFAIHSWDDAEACRRMEQLLRASDPDLIHYSVLPERALMGTPEEVAASITSRIKLATAVVVINTPGLHRRPTAELEMATAVEMNKRIVVVQPPRRFDLPVPEILDGHVYRHAPWRSEVVGRAIRGEYPHDGRVFDIAEVADRRELIGVLAAGTAAASFVLAGVAVGAFKALALDLKANGVELRWGRKDSGKVAGHAIAGAAIGGLLGSLTGDAKSALFVAGAGAAIGIAIGVHRAYEAHLLGTSRQRVLAISPI